jgi:hypothetical protein
MQSSPGALIDSLDHDFSLAAGVGSATVRLSHPMCAEAGPQPSSACRGGVKFDGEAIVIVTR